MKNRTLTGIICIVLAVAAAFVLIPFLNKTAAAEKSVIRIKENLKSGSLITEESLETVSVQASSIPDNAITDASDVVGKYALCDLFAGDYLIPDKITEKTVSASFALLSLNPGELAVTVEITSFADGFSGQLVNGDIVSLFIFDKSDKTVTQLPELQYVSVITTVNSNGNDLDSAETEDENIPKTLMLRVNSEQAALLFGYSNSASVCCAFVCHADGKDADKYLATQADYFTQKSAEADINPGAEDVPEAKDPPPEDDIIGKARSIVFNGSVEGGD